MQKICEVSQTMFPAHLIGKLYFWPTGVFISIRALYPHVDPVLLAEKLQACRLFASKVAHLLTQSILALVQFPFLSIEVHSLKPQYLEDRVVAVLVVISLVFSYANVTTFQQGYAQHCTDMY